MTPDERDRLAHEDILRMTTSPAPAVSAPSIGVARCIELPGPAIACIVSEVVRAEGLAPHAAIELARALKRVDGERIPLDQADASAWVKQRIRAVLAEHGVAP